MTMNGDYEYTPLPPEPRRLALPVATPWATYVLIGLNVAAFIPTLLSSEVVYGYGALIPAAVAVYGQWWRLLTAAFLHGGLMHIVFNLYALRGLGTLLEHFFDPWRFLAVYFGALWTSSVLVTLFAAPDSVTVGASGAIMGVLGALVIFYWRYRTMLVGGQRYLNEMLKMAALNVLIGFTPGISFWGHFGGLLGGLLLGWALCPRYEYDGFSPTLERLPAGPREWIGVLFTFGAGAAALMVWGG